MEPSDDYRPDPPRGLGYQDFMAARGRFFARLHAQSQIAMLERALLLPTPGPGPQAGAGEPLDERCAGDVMP